LENQVSFATTYPYASSIPIPEPQILDMESLKFLNAIGSLAQDYMILKIPQYSTLYILIQNILHGQQFSSTVNINPPILESLPLDSTMQNIHHQMARCHEIENSSKLVDLVYFVNTIQLACYVNE